MSCTCPETNFMDGKGHDPGCPLAAAALTAEVARLTRERDEWQAQTGAANGAFERARERAEQADAELARLRTITDEMASVLDAYEANCPCSEGISCDICKREVAVMNKWAALESTRPQGGQKGKP